MKTLLCEFANSAIRTNSCFKGKHKALCVRRGYKRSIIAIGHKLLEVIFYILRDKVVYRDTEIDYEKEMVNKNASRWIKALQRYGHLALP